jgi:hypothetical protein
MTTLPKRDHYIKQYVLKNVLFNERLPHPVTFGPKVGLLIALKREDGSIGIGWSKCAKQDKFNKELAETIAVGRALLWDWNESQENTPFAISRDLQHFRERAYKYFKMNQ